MPIRTWIKHSDAHYVCGIGASEASNASDLLLLLIVSNIIENCLQRLYYF